MSHHPTELSYRTAFEGFKDECARLIVSNQLHAVCEVGGGRFPLFGIADLQRLGLEYTVSDISSAQLELTPPGYSKLCMDICSQLATELHGRFDFIFTKMVAEHVRSGDAMHRNVFALLRPGGLAFHFYPTLYYPAFVANYLMPDFVSRPLVWWLQNKDIKFKAHYSRCGGPTPRMSKFLERVGYEVVDFRPFYGADYLDRVPLLRTLEREFSAWAARRRNPFLSSFAYLVLRKPTESVTSVVTTA